VARSHTVKPSSLSDASSSTPFPTRKRGYYVNEGWIFPASGLERDLPNRLRNDHRVQVAAARQATSETADSDTRYHYLMKE
jgi:hypothetical protein